MFIDKKKETAIFLIATFLLTAACWLPLALLRLPVKETGSVLSNMLYILGGVSPAVIALLLPLTAKKGERKAFYSRYFKFRVPLKWYIIPIVAVLLLVLIPYGIISIFFKDVVLGMSIKPLYMIIPAFFSMIIGGGLEELGWRGILVHNLKKNNPALVAAGIGLFWFYWHLPLFFLQGTTQYHASVIPFLLFVMTCSFATTIIYLKSGSIVPCILFHALINAFAEIGFGYGTEQLAASITDNSIRLIIAVVLFIFLGSKWYKIVSQML